MANKGKGFQSLGLMLTGPFPSKCPFCNGNMSSCPHSIHEAREQIVVNRIRSMIREEISRILAAEGLTGNTPGP